VTLVLLLGGARSGKSRLAQQLALASGAPVTFVATATARDTEMADKIAIHRHERPPSWQTVEEPLDVAGALSRVPVEHAVILDCLTLWVANLIDRGDDPSRALTLVSEAAEVAAGRTGATIVVSNEVGLGVVPASELGRAYRDVLGEVNQAWAALADRVLVTFAGRALPLLSPEEIVSGG
jgi:adenosyl cobinamide kinase/adenosyl cobinamide phosphate guanylyltransferase